MSIGATCPRCGVVGGCICDTNAAPPIYELPPAPVFHPPGCICPPTSEQTCQNPACPRKGVNLTAYSTADNKEPET